ncbi:MAG TPA: hypothetical protein VHU19_07340 [Pyrinomonadaceae bacterium]|jgi:type IV secretory pathway VirB10-like protein|nr:hypothetical protein [Pyrinomonadaceae bacterium]
MRLKTLALLLCPLLFAPACGSRGGDALPAPPPTPQASPPPAANATGTIPKSVTCALLSGADIREIQGEEAADAQGSEHLAGGLIMSQCFYRLPTFNKSVSLEVVRAGPGAPPDAVKKFWRQKFPEGAGLKRESERERGEREREKVLEQEKANGQVREGGHHEKDEDETKTRTQRVAGIGEEAYWSGGEKNGTFFVLRKGTVISVSVGGAEDEAASIKKARALTQKVLKHF